MWLMGRAFKAPKKTNVKQWRKVELLVRNGLLFHPNYGGRPKTLREAHALVSERLRNGIVRAK